MKYKYMYEAFSGIIFSDTVRIISHVNPLCKLKYVCTLASNLP